MMKSVVVSVSIMCACAVSALAQNRIVFDNQTGEPALVKLIGPTQTQVEVPNGAKVGADAAAGRYTIKVRYGTPEKYRYSKGEEFEVKETSSTRSEIAITLHKVLAGNYDSSPISESEFGAALSPRPGPKSVTPGTGARATERSSGVDKTPGGEQTAIEMLGFKANYDDMFTSKGIAFVGMAGDIGQSVSITRYFEPNSQVLIGYSWAPHTKAVAALTKQEVIAKCGKPDTAKAEDIGYGKVFLSFGADTRLNKITIHVKK